jgi:hypothetical protein
MTRLAHAWRSMTPEQRLAALASLGLFVSMFLPWYQQNAVVNAPNAAPLQSRNLNAFQVFSFVEAAVMLVAVAIIYLLFARAEGREFHLPGGDGTVVFAAGIWVASLLILRLFDKPGINRHGVAANVGVQWGIFFALAAAGVVAYVGSRMRAAARGEAPLTRRHRRRPQPGGDDEFTPSEPAAEEETTTLGPTPPRPKRATPVLAERSPGGRPRYPPAPSGQMSFEDPPAERDDAPPTSD